MILDICQCRIVTQLLSKWAGQNCQIWNSCFNIAKAQWTQTSRTQTLNQQLKLHLMTNSNINIYIKIIFNIKIQLILNININIDLTSHRVQSLKSKYFQRLCGCWSTKVQPWLGRLFANDLRLPVAGSQQRFIFNYVSINLCIAINGTLRLSRRKNQLWCESFRSWERNLFSLFSAKSSDEILTLITGYWADKSP